MKREFSNTRSVRIDPLFPNTVSSSLQVARLAGSIRDVDVTVDISHTFTDDLRIFLLAPTGQRVLLVEREGGRGDDFQQTTFDDQASRPIAGAAAPFQGRFRPEQRLALLNDLDPNGTWTLQIADRGFLDGGTLNRWTLSIDTDQDTARTPAFAIQVRFLGGLSASQQSVFATAAARWSEVIVGDLPRVRTDLGIVDDLVIDAQGTPNDGPGRVLGQAGPTTLRRGSLLPARGIMSFDTADLDRLEANGRLFTVILHEMGHALGIGTLWQRMGLLRGAGASDPVFIGPNAAREFAALRGLGTPTPVPVENEGGIGTRDGHFRETVFGNELMTGILDGGSNPLSRVTVASLQDMGYEVSLAAADPFTLPSALQLAEMAAGTERPCGRCQMGCPVPVVVPEDAMVG